MIRHCDVAHVVDPSRRIELREHHEDRQWENVGRDKTLLRLAFPAPLYNLGHLQPPSVYRLDILVTASNAETIEKTLEINLTGEWYDKVEEIMGKGTTIRFV